MHVLLVEDDEVFRRMIGSYLATLGSSWTYEEVSNGREAIDLLQAVTPDLIISDVKMPEVNGVELLEAVRDFGMLANTQVILMSSNGEYRQGALDSGAVDFLTKPFGLNTFQQILRDIFPEEFAEEAQSS